MDIALFSEILVLAADEIPPSNPLAQLATPLGILFFLGSTYLLLRSNLGTARAYHMLGTALFGFLLLMSLFWAFGAPGTPQATGPTNLPGQQADALQPKWVPFAQDSLLADRQDLSVVKGYPEGFEVDAWPADFQDLIDQGVGDLQSFFAAETAGGVIGAAWAPETVAYTETSTGFPLIAVEFVETDEALQPVPDGQTYVAFGYFDAGSPLLPALIFALISLILFLIHAWLLDRSERLERRELEAARGTAEEPDRVPANA
jgi:uncharacterized membrane protein